jgi:hypothetical protein
MPTIHLKGPGLNDYFAHRMVKDSGPEEALNNSTGPMRKAVLRVIDRLGIKVDWSKVQEEKQPCQN